MNLIGLECEEKNASAAVDEASLLMLLMEDCVCVLKELRDLQPLLLLTTKKLCTP
jgi:hypothetical protein